MLASAGTDYLSSLDNLNSSLSVLDFHTFRCTVTCQLFVIPLELFFVVVKDISESKTQVVGLLIVKWNLCCVRL